jgi:LytR cell envelope-related transcriptional attenuator
VDYPVEANRWRTRAIVLAAVAGLELFVLLGLGAVAAGRMLSSEVKTAARAHELPARKTPPAAAPDRPLLERSQTSVVVLNGNGVSGAAGRSAARVRGLTYVVAGAGNAPRSDYARTIVMYRDGYRREGERLAHDMHVKLVGPLDGLRKTELMGAHIALVLGR